MNDAGMLHELQHLAHAFADRSPAPLGPAVQEKKSGRRDLRFAVIGAGMAGILCAIKLTQSGHDDLTVFEKADRLGGTWRDNTYPGLTCDVPSHAYTYSFEPYPDWSRYLPPGAEILAYFERAAARFDVGKVIAFNEEIRACEFDGEQWRLTAVSGRTDRADVVIAATGVLHHPRYPDIPGAERFRGDLLHSARWDHGVRLDSRRIGIVGNGSSGVQLVSALAGRAAHLKHFQRTPQWIMPVENFVYSDAEREALRRDPELLRRTQNDPVLEANIERFSQAVADPNSDAMREVESLVVKNLEASVADAGLREKLRPDYRVGCKRLIYSPDYYRAIQMPNAELVTAGIRCVEPEGLRTGDGVLHPLDVLVYATGYQVDRFVRPMRVTGRNGVELDEVWSPAPYAYLSISVPGFPNFFLLNGPNGPVGNFSLIEIAERQWGYIEQLIEKIETGECRFVSADAAATTRYEKQRIAAAKSTVFGSGCRSWYLDANGVPATWPWTRAEFARRLHKPEFADFDLRSA